MKTEIVSYKSRKLEMFILSWCVPDFCDDWRLLTVYKTSLFIVWEVGKQGTIFGNANLANIKNIFCIILLELYRLHTYYPLPLSNFKIYVPMRWTTKRQSFTKIYLQVLFQRIDLKWFNKIGLVLSKTQSCDNLSFLLDIYWFSDDN